MEEKCKIMGFDLALCPALTWNILQYSVLHQSFETVHILSF